MDKYLDVAKKVFDLEASAITQLKQKLDHNFSNSVSAIIKSTGKVIICGMGKSGLIGQKIAATLASTGTASFSMHPGEAFHGDLGMIDKSDIFLAISNSGETEEVIRLIPFLIENKNIIIAMTGNKNSTLAKYATYHLNISVDEEACPLQLAPTSSTTATLAMGDALAVALMIGREFKPEHFAKFHPGGSLGKQLLTKVKDIMRKENLPFVQESSSMNEVIQSISVGRLGMTMVGSLNNFKGIITDGDLRRSLEKHSENFHLLSAEQIMTQRPSTVTGEGKVMPAIEKMNQLNVSVLPVLEKNKIMGVLHIFDCNL